ncbi:unnamed protein product [Moneuplotes crassus]|uniref:Uncharacterized protein n=1 Tax=Euplotes crassus TaxID=5936 RepID=A0AAD1XQH1_EUPCR|nr:unnamed protein product [Moneuplotes crassus]
MENDLVSPKTTEAECPTVLLNSPKNTVIEISSFSNIEQDNPEIQENNFFIENPIKFESKESFNLKPSDGQKHTQNRASISASTLYRKKLASRKKVRKKTSRNISSYFWKKNNISNDTCRLNLRNIIANSNDTKSDFVGTTSATSAYKPRPISSDTSLNIILGGENINNKDQGTFFIQALGEISHQKMNRTIDYAFEEKYKVIPPSHCKRSKCSKLRLKSYKSSKINTTLKKVEKKASSEPKSKPRLTCPNSKREITLRVENLIREEMRNDSNRQRAKKKVKKKLSTDHSFTLKKSFIISGDSPKTSKAKKYSDKDRSQHFLQALPRRTTKLRKEKSFMIPDKESYDEREIKYLTKKISQMEARIEEDYAPKSGEEKKIMKFANCPLDLNQWVKNAATQKKSLKPKLSEYPIEMLYNPKFDELERYFDIEEKNEKVRTLKIIPVTVTIDERYSCNPSKKKATKIDMNLLGDNQVHEHIYLNGLPSKSEKVVIPDPQPFDREKYNQGQISKRFTRLKREQNIKRLKSSRNIRKALPIKGSLSSRRYGFIKNLSPLDKSLINRKKNLDTIMNEADIMSATLPCYTREIPYELALNHLRNNRSFIVPKSMKTERYKSISKDMQMIERNHQNGGVTPTPMADEEFLEKTEFHVIQPNIDHIYFEPCVTKKPRFSFSKEITKRDSKKKLENRTLDSLLNIIHFKSDQKDKKFKKGYNHYKQSLLRIKEEIGA